jgi:radical SAM protein with 4Fe4S-binding SPASM domain
MKIRRHSNAYNFIGDTETGMTFRWGKNFKDNPLYAPHPELADISISNHCSKGCSFCYKNSTANDSFMNVEDYAFVLNAMQHSQWGNVFQVAIGGGEPLEHPNFIEIINVTRSFNIIPNFTTNGKLLEDNLAEKIASSIGALAISCQDMNQLNLEKIFILSKFRIKTNIHFLLNSQTITQAIDILNGSYNKMLSGINAIIFLTHKPVGRAKELDMLCSNEDFITFVNMIDKSRCNIKIGFDACFVPNLMRYTKTNPNIIEACECAYFSVYIDENMNVKPCSFTNDDTESFNLKEYSFDEIWNVKFESIRQLRINDCKHNCSFNNECRGGCPYFSKLNICKIGNL